MKKYNWIIFVLVLWGIPSMGMSAESYTVSLNNGWQMVSFPFTPSEGADKNGDEKIAAILGPEGVKNALSIWSWTGNTWAIYPSSLKNDYNSVNTSGVPAVELSELVSGKGYWFRTSNGASFTVTTTEARETGTQTLSSGTNVFNLVGFTFQGNVDISALNQGDSPLLSLESGDIFRLWHWEGTGWCVYTNDEGGVARLNQNYGLTLSTCSRLKEGQGYWIQVNSGGRDLGLALPPTPNGTTSSVYGLVMVQIGDLSKPVVFYENDYVTPINEVEALYDAESKIITFSKSGYITRQLANVETIADLKANYSMVKEDPSLSFLPSNANRNSTERVFNDAGDIIIGDKDSSVRTIISGWDGTVGAVVTVTPMKTVSGVPKAQELVALGKVISGFSVNLRNSFDNAELVGGYRALEGWTANVKPVFSSNAILNSSGSETKVITPLDVYRSIVDTDGISGNLAPISALKLYYYDHDPDDNLNTLDGVWLPATSSGSTCAIQLSPMTAEATSGINGVKQGLESEYSVDLGEDFTNLFAYPDFRKMKGEYVFSLESCTLDQLYSNYALVMESSEAPARNLRIQVVDSVSGVGIADTGVLVDGMLEYTTDENGMLENEDGTPLNPVGVFEYQPTLGTKRLVVVAKGQEHYANFVDVPAGALLQCASADFEEGGACVGSPNDVILPLQKRADTGTIVGLVELLDDQFGAEPFPDVTVSLRYPTSINAEQVTTNLDSESEFAGFSVGADATAKFRWSFYPIEGTAKVQNNNSAQIVKFQRGGSALARVSTVKDESGNDVTVALPDGGTATLIPLFVDTCEAGHHPTCVPDSRVLSGSYGQILGSEGGEDVVKKQVIDAIIRENYLTGDYGIHLEVEHCIPLVMNADQIAANIPETEQCTRTVEEATFAYTGKDFTESLQGGSVRVEVLEDAISKTGTITSGTSTTKVLGGVSLPYLYAQAALVGFDSLKWYATVIFKDSLPTDEFPGTNTVRGTEGAYTTITPPQNCFAGDIHYYLNFSTATNESNVSNVWPQTDASDFCEGYASNQYPQDQKALAEKYGTLIQQWSPGDSTNGFVVNSEAINQILLERFAQMALPIDERFTNGSTQLKEDNANGSLAFLQDYLTVAITVVIEDPDNAIPDLQLQTASGFFNIHLGTDKVYEGIEVSAGDFKPTSELPTEVTTKTDSIVETLDGENLSLNYQFNGIPFDLSDLLRVALRVDRQYQPRMFGDDNLPILDIRFDQVRYGGNGNGVIDGTEIRQFVSESMPVGHFEPDNTNTGIREDVAQVNLLYEYTPVGHIKGQAMSSNTDTFPLGLNNAKVFLGNKFGETQTLTSSGGKFVFTDVLVGTYQVTIVAGDHDGDGVISTTEKHLPITFSVVVEENEIWTGDRVLPNNNDGATTLPYLVVESVKIEQNHLDYAYGVIRGFALQSAALPIENRPASSGNGGYEVSCTQPTTPGGPSDCYDPDTGAGGTVFTSDSALTLIVNGNSITRVLPAGQSEFEIRFPLSPGNNSITMRAFNSLGENLPKVPEFNLDFTAPTGTIFGQVTDRDTGFPLPNALVVIETEGFRSVTTTDGNGNFHLTEAPALRTTTLEIGKEGYGAYEQEFYLERSGRVTLNIALDPVPPQRAIDTSIPPRIIMQIDRDREDPSLWKISGSVENTDAESMAMLFKNYETGEVESRSTPLLYGKVNVSTHSLFAVRTSLKPGYNLVQAKVRNSDGQTSYSRALDVTVQFTDRSPYEFLLEAQDPSRDFVKRSGRVKGTIKRFYQGSVIQVWVNGSLDTERNYDNGTMVDTNADGIGDIALKNYNFPSPEAHVNIVYAWDDVTLENGIMNKVEVKLIIAKDSDNDGRIDVSEDLDGDGRLDPNNGSNYIGPGSANPLEPTGGCTEPLYLGGEDTDCDRILDPGEDRDGDGKLDLYPEDLDGDLTLDQDESSDEFQGAVYTDSILILGFSTIPSDGGLPLSSVASATDDYITVGLSSGDVGNYTSVELWIKAFDETCQQARSGWFRTYAGSGMMAGWYGQMVDEEGIMTVPGTELFSIDSSTNQLTQTIPAVKAGCYQILGGISMRNQDNTYPEENRISFIDSNTSQTIPFLNANGASDSFPWVKWYWGPWYVYQGWIKVPGDGSQATFHQCTGEATESFVCETPSN